MLLDPRNRSSLRLLSLLLLSGALLPSPSSSQDTKARFVDHQPEVTLALRPHSQRFNDGNSAVVVGSTFAVIIDAPADRSVIQRWVKELADHDFTSVWLVNTHWHADHTQGNLALKEAIEGLKIVGHESLTEDIPERAQKAHVERAERLQVQIPLARKALAKGESMSGRKLTDEEAATQEVAIGEAEAWLAENQDTEFAIPNNTYSEYIVLAESRGESSRMRQKRKTEGSEMPRSPIDAVELHHFRAHTRGDTVVVVPQRRLAFTGDLLDELPFVGHGTPRAWIEALDAIAELPVDTFVPGHGQPFGREHLKKIRSYLQALVAAVDHAKKEGRSLEDAIAGIKLQPSRTALTTDAASERFFDGSLADAVTAAWNEQKDHQER